MLIDLDGRSAGWLAVALGELRKRQAHLGLAPPPSMIELENCAHFEAKRSHSRPNLEAPAPDMNAWNVDELAELTDRKLVSYRVAAERLGVGLRTFGRLVAAGDIPTVRTHEGARPRVRIADLDQYIASRTEVDRTGTA